MITIPHRVQLHKSLFPLIKFKNNKYPYYWDIKFSESNIYNKKIFMLLFI